MLKGRLSHFPSAPRKIMDPLSLVSGIAGTVAVGAKVLVALHGFVNGVKSAPEELKLLTKELDDLCQIMENFEKKTEGQLVSREIEDSSGTILDIFTQLNKLITQHSITEKDGFLKKGWKQIRWNYIEKDIAGLRVHLNANKGNLIVALQLANEWVIPPRDVRFVNTNQRYDGQTSERPLKYEIGKGPRSTRRSH